MSLAHGRGPRVYSLAMVESETPTGTPIQPPAPVDDAANRLATELGAAVLATLRRASLEGRLPKDLTSLGPMLSTLVAQSASDAALERRSGPVAPEKKRAPGTRTIRAMIRGARDIAQAPAGSELARYRVALLVLMLCLTALAGAYVFGVIG